MSEHLEPNQRVRRTRPKDCSWCSEKLNDEERSYPVYEPGTDNVMCDRCYDEHFRASCGLCEERFDKSDCNAKPGNLIVMWRPAPALAQDDLEPGYYRVLRWPMFADGMIEAYFYADHLHRVADLTERDRGRANDAWSLSEPMCAGCRDELERQLEAEAA